MNFDTLDLFSGCGGLSLGFEQAGFHVKVANDIWKTALESFNLNFPEANIVHGDLNKEETRNTIIDACDGAIDVIIGGPPCQAYSLAGNRDPDDPRGKLFSSYIEIVKTLNPKVFVVENVKGILSMKHFHDKTPKEIRDKYNEFHKNRRSQNQKVSIDSLVKEVDNYLIPVPELIKNRFEEIGYKTDYRLFNSADYGVPQQRQRVFFIGTNTENKIIFPEKTHSKNKEDNLPQWKTLRDALGTMPFPELGPDDEVYDGSFSYIYMSRNRRRSWDEASFTIQAGQRHIPLHPGSPPMKKLGKDEWQFGKNGECQRRLSVRECARIQTFPDSFKLVGNTSNKYKQIGNAVPSLLAKNMAYAVKKMLKQ